MSVIDPAMLDPLDEESSEWEYEYHDSETEVGMLSRPLATCLLNRPDFLP